MNRETVRMLRHRFPRREIATISLLVAVFFFLASGFVLGDATLFLLVSSAFASVPAWLGRRWIRVAGILVVVFSLGLMVVVHQRGKHIQAQSERLRQSGSSGKQ